MDAARHWAGGGVQNQADADLAAFGAPTEVIDKAAQTDDEFPVWEENLPVLSLFLRLQTQWNIINGIVSGLNYQSVRALFEVYDVTDKVTTFEDLQAMEVAALAVMNKRAADGA